MLQAGDLMSDSNEFDSLTNNLNRIKVHKASKRLFWDDKPIVTESLVTHDIPKAWRVFVAIVGILASVGAVLGGIATFNGEFCVVSKGSCAPAVLAQPQSQYTSRLAAFSLLFSPEETQSSSVASLQDALRILEGYPNSFAIIRLNAGDAQGPPQADQLALDRLNGVRAWFFECGVAPDRIRVELAASSTSHVVDDQGASAALYVPAIEIEIIAPGRQSS